MSVPTEVRLYRRNAGTLLASWEEYARGTTGAAVRRGYTLAEVTRAMGMSLDDIRLSRPEIELGPPDWSEYLRIIEAPPDLLATADPEAFHVLVARLDGENAAAAMAFDHEGECGIYNVETLEHVYATVGFRDLGRILEFVPQSET